MKIKDLITSIVVWMSGILIGAIISAIVLRIGWDNKEQILIYGYAATFSFIGWLWVLMDHTRDKRFAFLEKKIESLEKKLEEKADRDDVNALTKNIKDLNDKIDGLMKILIQKN